MCGRYLLADPEAVFVDLFGIDPPPGVGPRYNIAPTQDAPLVRRRDGSREAAVLRWGLIPHWARDADIGNRLINARSETAAEKPSFRDAFRRRRCLVPTDGFYEWEKVDGGKQPWVIRMAEGGGFALAGLWETWREADDRSIDTFTILTGDPNEVVARVHDRMPVIVARERFDLWLDPDVSDPEALRPVLRPYPASGMDAYPVSRRVNNPSNDDPGCVERVSD